MPGCSLFVVLERAARRGAEPAVSEQERADAAYAQRLRGRGAGARAEPGGVASKEI